MSNYPKFKKVYIYKGIPVWTDYPWKAEGCDIYGYREPAECELPNGPEEWTRIGHMDTAELADFVVSSVNFRFRQASQIRDN